ncbi:hypothetical protein MES5069_480024 [Mesorhizobium escarrei]|uniref:Uncharacterized protein n=1 Tax=Mesorhizobium escarrei TaxID=666018 RepID=A0ABM9SFT3_9HYPH|nr:hypothetical protein MES5069_480024 [Mesorhizobium escarrei]
MKAEGRRTLPLGSPFRPLQELLGCTSDIVAGIADTDQLGLHEHCAMEGNLERQEAADKGTMWARAGLELRRSILRGIQPLWGPSPAPSQRRRALLINRLTNNHQRIIRVGRRLPRAQMPEPLPR